MRSTATKASQHLSESNHCKREVYPMWIINNRGKTASWLSNMSGFLKDKQYEWRVVNKTIVKRATLTVLVPQSNGNDSCHIPGAM